MPHLSHIGRRIQPFLYLMRPLIMKPVCPFLIAVDMCPFARTYPSHPFLVCPSPAIAPFTPFRELNRNYLSLLTHVNCMKTFYKSLLISNRIQSSSVLLLLASRPLIHAPALLRTYPSQSPTTIGSHCVRYTPPSPGAPPRASVARKGLSNAYGRRIQPTQYIWDDASDICRNHLPDLIPICAPYPHISVASNQYLMRP